ncbi:HipA family kinase [Frankia sp. R82]|uniref:HipA family kinase n=1 Tax=Frankia sp. R82 TaxID=2950553 RepID=UPI0035ABEB1F
MRQVAAVRYAAALREGGSLPGLMEGDDLGTWVVKFRGAGQGRAALVAEVVVGELARELGLPVPEIVVVDVDPQLGRTEPDQEVQDLLRASAGANLGSDYLPGSITYDPLAFLVAPELAARVLWLDALTLNVDRSWRNPNLLVWGGGLWLIDHGAALYPHHDWASADRAIARSLPGVDDHVLLTAVAARPEAFAQADAELAERVEEALLTAVLERVPDDWLAVPPQRYVQWLLARVAARGAWRDAVIAALGSVDEAGRAAKPEDAGRSERSEQSGRSGRSGRPDWLRAGDWLRTGGARPRQPGGRGDA